MSSGPPTTSAPRPAEPGATIRGVPTIDSDAVVLRAIRYGEADSVLSILTPEHGRVSAIAKGVRRPKSRLAGRLQPGVRSRVTLVRGRGDLATVRTAHVEEPNAGLWERGYRLRAAGCVLEAALRTLPEGEPNEGAFHLVCRGLSMLGHVPSRDAPPRLDPVVIGVLAKLLVVAGLVPRLGPCEECEPGAALVAYSPVRGEALCRSCAAGSEPVSPAAIDALAGLLGRPLAEADQVLPPERALEVERMVTLTLREHMGVELRGATPVH